MNNSNSSSEAGETETNVELNAAVTHDALVFKVTTRTPEYGDKKKFAEYKILMYQGAKLVGIEDGPRRETPRRADALKAARARIGELKAHRLFVIEVTKKHIADGEARNCQSCAISQALWQNQERMGFSKYEYGFEVCPYACFIAARGIVLGPKYADEDEIHIPEESLPEMVTGSRGKQIFHESMVEWAMAFDDWGDSRHMSLKEWREARGYDDGERPYRPSPASFVLDLDAMQPCEV